MKILNRALLLSFISVLVISQGLGEDIKNSDDSFIQFGGDEIKEMAQFEQEHKISGIIYKDLPEGRKNVPIKTYTKKIKNNSKYDPVKVESKDYLYPRKKPANLKQKDEQNDDKTSSFLRCKIRFSF